ncbi:hypothetical protein [uncultured Limosilactobacillus sp.]|uniref:hypothetical protein n=1 Tax=uncultured Limosilactobacillus sp. TaxID=2837629 RepID=UPI0025D08814|nr:hypothetical protein [uncultured Limosilactobacillus sp.]
MLKRLILQLLIIVIWVVSESIVQRLSGPRHKTRAHRLWMLTVLLMFFAFWNVGLYWFCYVLIVWMITGMGLALYLFWTDHQIIYQQYWPLFWRVSLWIGAFAYLVSFFSHQLPQV